MASLLKLAKQNNHNTIKWWLFVNQIDETTLVCIDGTVGGGDGIYTVNEYTLGEKLSTGFEIGSTVAVKGKQVSCDPETIAMIKLIETC